MKKIVSTSILVGLLIIVGCKNKEQKVVKTPDAKTLMSESSESFIGFWNSTWAEVIRNKSRNFLVSYYVYVYWNGSSSYS